MSDLIDRKMAIDEVCRVCLVCCTETCQGRNPDSRWCEEITALRKIPPAEPKRGKWVQTNPPERSDNIVCDQCGYDSIAKFIYCPNCGAKMEVTE